MRFPTPSHRITLDGLTCRCNQSINQSKHFIPYDVLHGVRKEHMLFRTELQIYPQEWHRNNEILTECKQMTNAKLNCLKSINQSINQSIVWNQSINQSKHFIPYDVLHGVRKEHMLFRTELQIYPQEWHRNNVEIMTYTINSS